MTAVTILTLIYAYLLQVVLDATNRGRMERIVYAIIGMAGLFLTLFVLQMLLKRIRCAFVRIAMTQYKSKAFEKITQKGITTFLSENTSSYLSVLTNDASYIEEHYQHYLHVFFQIISQCISFLGAFVLMLWYNMDYVACFDRGMRASDHPVNFMRGENGKSRKKHQR